MVTLKWYPRQDLSEARLRLYQRQFLQPNKYGARPARAFPLVANKQHQAVISEISEIGWLRGLAGIARLAVLAG